MEGLRNQEQQREGVVNQHGIGAEEIQGGSRVHRDVPIATGARPDSIKVKPFVGKGWHLWKFKMQQYLDLMEVWEYVSGEIAAPDENASMEVKRMWRRQDLTARNVLCNSVDDERLQMLTQCKSAAEMWKVLGDKYEVVSIANEMRLDEEFNSLRQGNKYVDGYLKELNATIDNLRGIGKIISDRAKMLAFLKGLNKEYGVLSVMLENQTGMTFDQATASVLTHEMRHELHGGTSEDTGEAYFVGNRGRGKGGRGRGRFDRGRGRGRERSLDLTCFNCNQIGHLSRNCPDGLKNGITCLSCGKKGHLSYDCPSRKGKREQGEHYCAQGVVGEANAASEESTWIVDSGATHHMCKEKGFFSELSEKPAATAVLVGNNSRLEVEKEGKVRLNFSVGREVIPGTVDKVLYVPEMGKNLFSVTQTMRQGKSVLFDSKTMSCKILKGQEEVGTAQLKGGLWVLDCSPSLVGAANVVQKEGNMELWHQRLGHLGEDGLVKLQEKGMVKGLEKPLQGSVKGACEGCKEGKQHRESFPETEKIERKKLELIQSDIKGPITPSCHGGYRYFLTFLDVSTRKNWVYLLRNKSETFEIFKWWKAEVERQSDCKIKAFRSDHGGEYISKEFQLYLKNCGIKQEFTIARTPEQNGRAERLNRTLMEMSRAMTNGASLAKEFWGEGI